MSLIPNCFGRRSNAYDPFHHELWGLFDGWPSFRHDLRSNSETALFAGAMIDWRETPNAHAFKAHVPGLRKEEVKVELEDDRVLQISGERKGEVEDKGDTWHRVERCSGKFMRRFRLPENARVDQVNASMENGVLTVTVPKVDVQRAGLKNIEISGAV